MRLIVECHCHTYHSDGELSPQEIVERAQANKVELLSITDHDSIAGYNAMAGQDLNGMRLIPGVEISSKLENTELHIVGLGFDPKNQQLTDLLAQNRSNRNQRAQKIIDKLIKLGYPDLKPYLDSSVKGEIISRTHFAKALLDVGLVSNYEQAFKKFIGKGGKVWFSSKWPSIEQVIKTIQQAGGKAVLAHPTKYRLSSRRMTWVIEEFAAYGGDALEINYPGLSPNHRSYLKRLAIKHDLSISVGSDFHRPAQTWAKLGGFSQFDPSLSPVWEQLAV